MSSSRVVLAVPAILLGGLLTDASAQPKPVAPDAIAVLDALRTTYQNCRPTISSESCSSRSPGTAARWRPSPN